MKKSILFMTALILFSVNVEAGPDNSGLRDLIQENIQDAEKSYEQTISPIEQQRKTFSLWINVSGERQIRLGEEIRKRIADTDLGEKGIENKPIQLVDNGPPNNQLRYFKKEDAPHAAELLSVLRKFIPNINLKDYSRQYSDINWITPGHLELWLSPRLKKIRPPKPPRPDNSFDSDSMNRFGDPDPIFRSGPGGGPGGGPPGGGGGGGRSGGGGGGGR
jgi:hypothetical protein